MVELWTVIEGNKIEFKPPKSLKHEKKMNGSTVYDEEAIFKHDKAIVNKMIANIIATLRLIKLSVVSDKGLIPFLDEAGMSGLTWRTPLGKYIASALTRFRSEKIGMITRRTENLDRDRQKYFKAIQVYHLFRKNSS